jgi:ribose transport system permease protein
MTAQPPLPAASAEPGTGEGLSTSRWRDRRLRAEHIRDYGILLVVAGLFIGLSLASPAFLTVDNMLNILYQNAPVGIMACAVTLVVVGGNFDLSLGAMFSLSGVCAAWIAINVAVGLAFPAAIAAGAVMGLLNGLLVTELRVNAFLATLATSLVYRGAATAISGGYVMQVDSGTFTTLGQERLGRVQYSVIVFVVVAVLLEFVLSRTMFGRYVYAVGGNRDAARLSGLKVDRIVITTFVIAGLAAGLAGLIDASTTGSGASTTGIGLELTAIAAVALGGTSIFGGVGSVWRTVVGVMLLALITNGFNLLGVESFYQDIVKGGLIVAAVAIGSVVERR